MKAPHTRGFLTIPVAALLMVVIVLGIAALAARTRQVAMYSHRTLMQTQLRWAAHSAAEQAVAIVREGLVPTPLEHETQAWLAPAYSDIDPLEQWDIHPVDFQPHTIPLVFRYTIEAAEEGYEITAAARMNYRGSSLQHEQVFLCIEAPSGTWSLVPVQES